MTLCDEIAAAYVLTTAEFATKRLRLLETVAGVIETRLSHADGLLPLPWRSAQAPQPNAAADPFRQGRMGVLMSKLARPGGHAECWI